MHYRKQELGDESNENLRDYGKRNQRLLEMFLDEIKYDGESNIQICDFGSGCAHIARSIKETLGKRAAVTCVESNNKVIPFYETWGLSGKKNANELGDNTFDIIYMVEVLEHLDDPQTTLITLRKKIKPNGLIFITTPEGRNNEVETNAYENPAHVHFFTEKSLDKLLESCNLEKLKHVNRDIMYSQPGDNPLPRKDAIRKKARQIKALLVEMSRLIANKRERTNQQLNNQSGGLDMTPRRYHLVGFSKHI